VAYRVGDSVTNIISPMMSYFALILAFMQRYEKKAGIGTIVATMLPYTVAFLACWVVLLAGWMLLDLPLGPGSVMHMPTAPARSDPLRARQRAPRRFFVVIAESMRILWVALAALGLWGCSGKAKAQCEKEARELGAFLSAADTGPETIFIGDADLVERSDLKPQPLELGAVAHVGPAGFRANGLPVLDLDALGSELARARERRKELHSGRAEPPPGLDRVAFVFDKATPWSQVVAAVAAAAKAGLGSPAFAFSAPAQTAPPPRAPVDEKLDAIFNDTDPANKATGLAMVMS
jgi:hypothetical protein